LEVHISEIEQSKPQGLLSLIRLINGSSPNSKDQAEISYVFLYLWVYLCLWLQS